MGEILLKACGVFYSVLCVFSIVTGLMYATGKKELNPLELSDQFMSKNQDPEKRKRFTIRMGWVTFVVGIVQGITAFSIFRAGSAALLPNIINLGMFSFSV
ncbi:MAG: hypothetical protein IJV41_10870 [Oscillospiraceae bacterium]|nr:hypothetical protein [Oscillospiraceae bacterium]